MRCRHKPTEVRAQPFYPGKLPWPEGVFITGTNFTLRSLDGLINVKQGDYIITNARGEKSTMRADHFKDAYEILPVEPVDPNAIKLPG